MFGFGKHPERASAEAREAQAGAATVDRAKEGIQQLREKPGFMDQLSKEAASLRAGALLLGLMVPTEALAHGPHDRVEELGQMIEGVDEYLQKLEKMQARYERQNHQYPAPGTSKVTHSRVNTGYQVFQVKQEIKRTERLKDTLEARLDKTEEKVTKAHEKRGERLEKKGKSPLELYDIANDAVNAYLQRAGVQENGRSLVVMGADGSQRFIDVPYEYEIFGFDFDGGNDLTIKLQKADGSFYGVFFDNGIYVDEAPINKRGSKL